MDLIVMDLEWNQARTYAQMIKEPVFLTGEIIQIGAVKLDAQRQPADCFDRRVKPQYYTTIHPKVAELTGLGDRDLCRGESFLQVYDAFSRWCGEDFLLLVWGTEDQRILRKNMDLHGLNGVAMPPCLNLQNIFARQVTLEAKQVSLSRALALVQESPFPAHDALNDAKSTALLCRHLDMERGLAEYQDLMEHRPEVVESFEFEEQYLDIADALSDDYVISFECPTCGEIVWGDDWVKKNATTLLSPGRCGDGQEFLIKLKFRPVAGDRVTVKRQVYPLTEELRTTYQCCVEQAALWRKYVVEGC